MALVEQPLEPLPAFAPETPPGKIFNVRDLPGKYWMHVRVPAARQLVLTETYHPQWRCAIDGKEVPVYLTDYTFMSVRVPPGEHEVRWWFEPTRFKQGLAVTLAGLAVTLALLVLAAYLRRRKPPTRATKPQAADGQPA